MFRVRPLRIAAALGAAAVLSAAGFGLAWSLGQPHGEEEATWVLFGIVCVAAAAALLLFFRYVDRRDQLAALNAELDRVARIDSLTGVHNRRHLDEQLTSVLSAARRHREAVALLLFDIDEFKTINDGSGHAAGDAVLVEVASRLRSGARAEDIVGRWGGDEFMLIMPATDTRAARAAAERLSRDVCATQVDAGSEHVPLSMSTGVASGVDLGPDDLLRRADIALYAAKHAGRGRVISAADSEPPPASHRGHRDAEEAASATDAAVR